MDNTPKLQRKSSLSLTTRLSKKRHSASPQNIMKTTAASNNALNSRDTTTRVEVPRSPSVISICSDGGIECCTPPHKKINMCFDDCGDYSPKVFDSSFSPSCLLSQTLAIDSPEVGWKWSRYSNSSKDEVSTRTPDSAYAADSSFTSAGSSSTEITNARARTDTYNQRMAYDVRREQQLRKVEKTRADQKLKLRCAKLQEQLKSAGTQKSNSSPNNGLMEKSGNATTSSSCTLTATDTEMTASQTTTSTVKMVSPMEVSDGNASETINDFFNDSDEDCFLLAATQEIESKMMSTAHNTTPAASENNDNPSIDSTSAQLTGSPSATTPSTSTAGCLSPTKEKRSSFYMKFLEDDCSDDWFVSLDEIIEQATQPKKPRTSFQRYKSMPMNNNDSVANCNAPAPKSSGNSDPTLNSNVLKDTFVESKGKPTSSSSSLSLSSKIKRHSSSHALPSPSNANYRRRQHQ